METCYRGVLDQYLVPSPADRELVVLSDSETTAAVLASRSNTVAVSREAAQILHSSLVGAVPVTLRDIVGNDPDRIETASSWVKDSNEDGIFHLSPVAPTRKIDAPVSMDGGSYIAVSDFGDGRGVQVEYPGRVTKALVNGTVVYWYAGSVSLKDKHCVTGIGRETGVSARGEYGASLLPRPIPAPLGANCNVCTACGGCGACGACGLCGGADFAAAALALVAVDAALTLTNAIGLAVLRHK